jgi:hypothetical protein
MQREKSHVEALSLGGVPVLRRMRSNPRFAREVESLFAAGLPSPPDSTISCPMKILPRKAVPLVTTTASA